MPVAQFNQFEKLDRPIMQAGGPEDAAYKQWVPSCLSASSRGSRSRGTGRVNLRPGFRDRDAKIRGDSLDQRLQDGISLRLLTAYYPSMAHYSSN
jgi:hypothetical protein